MDQITTEINKLNLKIDAIEQLLKKPFGAWAEGEKEEFGNKEQLRKKESSSEKKESSSEKKDEQLRKKGNDSCFWYRQYWQRMVLLQIAP